MLALLLARDHSRPIRHPSTKCHVRPRQTPAAQRPRPPPSSLANRSRSSSSRPTATCGTIFSPGSDGMTVADLMVAASHLPKGIQFSQQGSGESALLTEINGDANQGGDGKNWIYSVNGNDADRSFAIYKLEPGDHVLWTFSTKQ